MVSATRDNVAIWVSAKAWLVVSSMLAKCVVPPASVRARAPRSRATTGAYGHTMKKSYALAYLDAAHAAPGTKLEIVILDQRLPCIVVPDSPWDPENERLRA